MKSEKTRGLTSFQLHILAMVLMLVDHMWATLFPQQEWMTCIGRLAFPIFAFMIVEGYFHTADVHKYIVRMLIFALISEVPFDLVYGSSVFYLFHQNVLWTFLIGLISIHLCEKARAHGKWWLTGIVLAAVIVFDYAIGTVAMVDYFGAGILTVMTFYIFRKRTLWGFLGQLVCLAYLNISLLGSYFYPVTIGGVEFKIVQQSFALLALIPIWLYKGEQGYHSKAFQYICYAFYPVHLAILYVIWQMVQ